MCWTLKFLVLVRSHVKVQNYNSVSLVEITQFQEVDHYNDAEFVEVSFAGEDHKIFTMTDTMALWFKSIEDKTSLYSPATAQYFLRIFNG